MIIFKKAAAMQAYLRTQRTTGSHIAFIPTMGALHAGHTSLVKAAATKNGNITVCSIFVNPTQFNDKADFEKYPMTVAEDVVMLTKAGCHVLFLPDVDEVYPNGFTDGADRDFGYLDTVLEGARRPGHFRGVGQVVARLLQLVQPSVLYLGQKDYQQVMVIKELLRQMGSDTTVEIIPTTREADGLAMSSRNRRLTEPQRALAGVIYQCLVSIQTKQGQAPFAIVQKECETLLRDKGFEPEYVALADAEMLGLMSDYEQGKPTVALIAAHLGSVRLIDNMML